jgi:hypothetical protein
MKICGIERDPNMWRLARLRGYGFVSLDGI